MMNATETKMTTRRVLRDGRWGFVVSVANGPQDLLWRLTEQAALNDGAAYVKAHWALGSDGWKAV